jgi:hypothetical protein
MIVGCLITFECAKSLGKTLESIKSFVDRIIVVDGAFEGFSDHIQSQDATRLIVKGFSKPWLLDNNSSDHPWRSEMMKRNQYLIPTWHMRKGEVTTDWILIIDGDEYVVRGQEETRNFLANATASYYNVTFWYNEPPGTYTRAGSRLRLFRYVKGMRYVDNHHTILYPDGRRITGWDAKKAKIAPLHIVHDQTAQSEEYRVARERYNTEVRPKLERTP